MDVNHLMCDLNIEQIVELQKTLDVDIENKKEELRQMVGRRYRDVLESSNAVKYLTKILNEIKTELKKTSSLSLSFNNGLDKKDYSQQLSLNFISPVKFLIMYNTFIAQVYYTGDNISDVFCLLIAENFHRKFASKSNNFEASSNQLFDTKSVLQEIVDRLIMTRLELTDCIINDLGCCTDWHSVTGNLAAIALLKKLPVESLMDLYLQSRLNQILLCIKSTSTSLIEIIRMLRDTIQIIEDVFGQNGALLSALKKVTVSGWSSEIVKLIINDQLNDYSKLINEEIVKINDSYPQELIIKISTENVKKKCTKWIKQMCLEESERVSAMCEHFKNINEIIEFITAINQLFKSEWPSVILSSTIYQSLFGDLILHRFRTLINQELSVLEKKFLEKYSFCNCKPVPLFQKRATKFNALLASGVSQELNDLVKEMFDGMKEILINVNKYVSIGCENNVVLLQVYLAESVLLLVDRFLNYFEISKELIEQNDNGFKLLRLNNSTSINVLEAQKKWFSTFCVFLAFVQHEPSIFCLCMNRDSECIARCNKILYSVTELALCNFMDYMIDEFTEIIELKNMPIICMSETLWLGLIKENEKIKLDSSDAGSIFVPTQISKHYFLFLYNISRQINNYSIGHLFTRKVTDFVSKKLGNILASSLKLCCKQCLAATTPICVQLLFDCKAFFFMFLSHEFIEAAQIIESKLDLFDLKLLEAPLSRNAKLFVQRTLMLFGQLQIDSVSLLTKQSLQENLLSPSYTALVDITAKLNDVRRLTLIPRLSKLKNEDDKRQKKTDMKSNEIAFNEIRQSKNINTQNENSISLTTVSKIPSAGSFTSFYDKISNNWFKN